MRHLDDCKFRLFRVWLTLNAHASLLFKLFQNLRKFLCDYKFETDADCLSGISTNVFHKTFMILSDLVNIFNIYFAYSMSKESSAAHDDERVE